MSNKSKNLVTLVTTHVGRQGSVDLSAVPGSNPKQLIYAYLKFNLTHTFCNFSLSFSVNCENELKIEKKNWPRLYKSQQNSNMSSNCSKNLNSNTRKSREHKPVFAKFSGNFGATGS